MTEGTQKQFPLTRVAPGTCRRSKTKFFSVAKMKAQILIGLVGATISALAQEAPHEIRMVSGTAVDLTPVIRWHQTQATNGRGAQSAERPMPHWKALIVRELKEHTSSWDRCTVLNEQGDAVDIYLANMQPEVRVPLAKLQQINLRIQELTNAIAGEQGRANSYASHTSVAGQRLYAGAQGNANTMRMELSDLYGQRQTAASEASTARNRKVFAMFTGRKYAGLEIWDCGVRR